MVGAMSAIYGFTNLDPDERALFLWHQADDLAFLLFMRWWHARVGEKQRMRRLAVRAQDRADRRNPSPIESEVGR